MTYAVPVGPGVEDQEKFLSDAIQDGSNRYITMAFKDIIAGTATATRGSILEGIEKLKKSHVGFPEEIYKFLSDEHNPNKQPKVQNDVDGELNTDCDEGNNRYIVQTLTNIAEGKESAKRGTIKKAIAVLQKNRVTVPDLKGMLDRPGNDGDYVSMAEAEPASKEEKIAALEKQIKKYEGELSAARTKHASLAKSSSMAVAAKAELNKIEKLEKNIKECKDKIRWANN